jgi:hypothetical protein
MVLPSGELHIRDVSPEDGYKSYRCRTKHRLTGETRLSATAGRLVVTGELPERPTQVLINFLQPVDKVSLRNFHLKKKRHHSVIC